MYTGQIISGAGHAALILWLLLGDWLFSPPEPVELAVVSGSIISSAELDALQAAARANIAATPPPVETPPVPVAEEVPEPVVEPAAEPEVVEPPPEPVVEELPPEPEVVPEGVTGFADPAPLPPSDDPQPLPNPLADARPRPRPSDIIAPTPVEETPDVTEDEVATPAVTEQVTDQPVVEQPPVEETAPVAAADEIIPEQPEPPTLAPTSSPRPRARPTQVAAVEPEEVAEPVSEEPPADAPVADEPAAEEPVPDAAADQAAIDAALEAALAGEATEGGGTTQSLGESLNAAELNGLANTINRCWDLGAAGSAALNVSITLLITLDQSSKPINVELVESSGDTPEAIATARRAAISAVRDCGREGLGLPPEKYDTWKQIEVVFDPRGAQLR